MKTNRESQSIIVSGKSCYHGNWSRDHHLCHVILTGESGAGKTESTKFILRYVADDNTHREISILRLQCVSCYRYLTESYGSHAGIIEQRIVEGWWPCTHT